MATDIFKLFKNSVQDVRVMKLPRGTLSIEAPIYDVTLKGIVKLRDGMSEAVAESEDRNNTSSIHLKASDAQYVEIGNYALIQGEWRTIERIRWGKDFDKGSDEFLYAFVGTDIIELTEDVVWE